jgi:hypothetical protein
MSYLVEIYADDRRSDWQLFEDKKCAEDRYYRALALVTLDFAVRAWDGRAIKLLGCYLYEVATEQMSVAQMLVQKNDVRRVQSSDDPLCGEEIVVEGLFKIIH